MKRMTVILLAALALGRSAPAQGPSVAELEKRHRDNPVSLKAKVDLAEAYLRECELEKSLAMWRRVLQADPQHKRARRVIERLTLQALDLDSHLDVLQALIEKGFVGEGAANVAGLLEAASQRAATDSQKARILYLRGLAAARRRPTRVAPHVAPVPPPVEPEVPHVARTRPSRRPSRAKAAKKTNFFALVPDPAAVSYFEAARRLYPKTVWARMAAIALADLEARCGGGARARSLLTGVVEDRTLRDRKVKDLARLALAQLTSSGLTGREKVSALREALAGIADASVKRRALTALSEQIRLAHGGWSAEAVEALGAALATGPPHDEAAAMLAKLAGAAEASQDAAALSAVAKVTREAKLADRGLARKLACLGVAAALARAAVEEDLATVKSILAGAGKAIDALARDRAASLPADRKRVEDLRGRALLVEAQKLLALQGPTQALPVLVRAKQHYLAAMSGDPRRALSASIIAQLLEHVQEWATAAALYREVCRRFPHTVQGRDALLKVARIYDGPLAAPMMALDVYLEYASRYPAELPYRQLAVGRRLRRLGFANLLDFQKRTRLKADGLFGPISARMLSQVESAFDMIGLGPEGRGPGRLGGGVLRGAFVHPALFKIARSQEQSGRHREAIRAYRALLNLFPTKAEADDALLAIARLFRENLLFAEALGAYNQLMADYPEGNRTSEAYIEAAGCLENLGRLDEARRMYELYVRKFPKYKHVKLCQVRLGLLAEIRQYESFIGDNPNSPKVAEAQYQIATILYKQLRNYTKAAVEFVKVADRHPKHARAPEGLFTAGAAQLRAGNFPAARKVFERLAKDHRDSRLADDGQYWIGHTWEYSARALGRLDAKRIMLKQRSLRARAALLADLTLRRHYEPKAQPGPAVPEEIWGGDTLGLLTSGSKRDRVNADLYRAIRAYRKVVDDFKMADSAGNALLRIGAIYTQYLKDPQRGIQAYQELLANYPASKEAAGALYEVGAYHLDNKKYDDAIKAYQQFVFNYPRHAKAEDAMLSVARCYMEKKDWNKALDAFQSYLSKYPTGRHAAFVKAQIEWIRMYHF